MDAIVHARYGGPEDLVFRSDVAAPTPASDEVLVRMHASSVHADVWHVVAGRPYALRVMGAGVRRPKAPQIPGTDVSGVVEAVGSAVHGYAVGDEVFGESVRGIPWHHGGAWAEFVTVPVAKLARKPRGVSHEQAAAAATTGMIALDLLGQGRMHDGARVLVNGAAGAVGSIVVQLALARGAAVTAVDRAEKLPMLRELGAQRVLDGAAVDYTAGSERYDVIVDIPGNHHWKRNVGVLADGGRYVPVGHEGYGQSGRWLGAMRQVIPLAIRATWNRRLAGFYKAAPPAERLAELARLLESGELTPHVDRAYPLAQAADAMRHLMTGSVQGRVVLTR